MLHPDGAEEHHATVKQGFRVYQTNEISKNYTRQKADAGRYIYDSRMPEHAASGQKLIRRQGGSRK